MIIKRIKGLPGSLTGWKLILILSVFLLAALLLSGCSNLVTQDGKGEGRVILTLSRGVQDNALSTSFSERSYNNLQLAEFDPSGVNPSDLPRSVSRVLNQIEGYIIGVTGGVQASCTQYLFEEDQDELTVELLLPAGVNQTITLLALGRGESDGEKVILGAGQASFVVLPDEITTVPIPMLPYKYLVDYQGEFTPGNRVPVSFYVLGPLMDELLALGADQAGSPARLYYSPVLPETAFPEGQNYLVPEISQLSSLINYDYYQFEVEMPDNSQHFAISEGESGISYKTHLKLKVGFSPKWQELFSEAGLTGLSFSLPDMGVADNVVEVHVTPGEGSGDENNNPSPEDGIITTIAGDPGGGAGFSGDGGLAVDALFNYLNDITLDREGNLYIVDTDNSRIRKIDTTGIITTVAGDGRSGYDSGEDGGQATNAQLDSPEGMTVDETGNIYIADSSAHVIRKVDINGIISTIAGTGENGYTAPGYPAAGDGGPASSALLSGPVNVAVDGTGNIYITGNHRVRMVDTEGIITTIAELNYPRGLALDESGNLYVAEWGTGRIKKITAGTWEISTVAGGGMNSAADYVGPATGAFVSRPQDVAIDRSGNLLFTDTGRDLVRKVDLTTGQICTVAGNGTNGMSGDGGPATEAGLEVVVGIAADADGNIYITDNNVIRKITY